MRGDTALLTKEEGGSPVRNPSTAAEDARLASLISLDGILKKVKVCKLHNVILLYQFLGAEDWSLKGSCVFLFWSLFSQDIMRQASQNSLTKSKKKALLASLVELSEQMPSLLEIDHPCAQKQIADARNAVEVYFYLLWTSGTGWLSSLVSLFLLLLFWITALVSWPRAFAEGRLMHSIHSCLEFGISFYLDQSQCWLSNPLLLLCFWHCHKIHGFFHRSFCAFIYLVFGLVVAISHAVESCNYCHSDESKGNFTHLVLKQTAFDFWQCNK